MAKDNRKKKAKRKNTAVKIMAISVLVFFVLVAIFGIILAKTINATSQEKDSSQSDVNKLDTTPNALQNKVAYYVVGLLGEDEQTGTLERLSIVCHDKKKNTINILEVPQDTYLGEGGMWTVKKTGQTWGNPAPLNFCEFDAEHLHEAEIAEHKAAGHTVVQKRGSAAYNVAAIFNEQYSLPVDECFFLSQPCFVKLVDLLGGVDIELEVTMELADVKYEKGIKTLPGAAALEYVLKRDKGAKGDVERLVRQRKVFGALFMRLIAQSEEKLTGDTLVPLMKGSTPIRMFSDLPSADLVKLVRGMANVTADKITVQLMPGGISPSGSSEEYYGVDRAALIEVLNKDFHPYDNPVKEADLSVTEVETTDPVDVQRQTFAEIVVEQSTMPQIGATTTANGTTTTTKAG